jgi:hypothetical protein
MEVTSVWIVLHQYAINSGLPSQNVDSPIFAWPALLSLELFLHVESGKVQVRLYLALGAIDHPRTETLQLLTRTGAR